MSLKLKESLELLKKHLESPEPCLIGRFSSAENNVVNQYLNGQHYTLPVLVHACRNAGISPSTPQMLAYFSEKYLEAVTSCDLISHPYYGMEDKMRIIKNLREKYCPNAKEYEYYVFESLFDPQLESNHWIHSLEGKRILVVNPFKKSIEEQCGKLEKIYEKCPKITPKWKSVIVVASPMTQTLYEERQKLDQELWKKQLKKLEDQVEKIKDDFDVVLLGCGAYGLPLGRFIVQKLQKKAIMYGGALQLLFGIKGARWNSIPKYARVMNDAWISPKEDERPQIWDKIEKGCYW